MFNPTGSDLADLEVVSYIQNQDLGSNKQRMTAGRAEAAAGMGVLKAAWQHLASSPPLTAHFLSDSLFGPWNLIMSSARMFHANELSVPRTIPSMSKELDWNIHQPTVILQPTLCTPSQQSIRLRYVHYWHRTSHPDILRGWGLTNSLPMSFLSNYSRSLASLGFHHFQRVLPGQSQLIS